MKRRAEKERGPGGGCGEREGNGEKTGGRAEREDAGTWERERRQGRKRGWEGGRVNVRGCMRGKRGRWKRDREEETGRAASRDMCGRQDKGAQQRKRCKLRAKGVARARECRKQGNTGECGRVPRLRQGHMRVRSGQENSLWAARVRFLHSWAVPEVQGTNLPFREFAKINSWVEFRLQTKTSTPKAVSHQKQIQYIR